MGTLSSIFGKKLLFIAIIVILTGCSSVRSSRFAISQEIHDANYLMVKANSKIGSGDFSGAIDIGNQILMLLDDSNFVRDEMKYKAAIQRANAWYLIGTSKLFLSVQQDGHENNFNYILPLLGTPKGGSTEFEKALSEISDGEQTPHKYRSQINPYLTKARAYMFLGRFQDAEATFLDSIEWTSQASPPQQFLYADYYWRAYLRNLKGFSMSVNDPDNKQSIRQMWSYAIEDIKRAQKNTSNSSAYDALENWIKEMEDKLKLVKL